MFATRHVARIAATCAAFWPTLGVAETPSTEQAPAQEAPTQEAQVAQRMSDEIQKKLAAQGFSEVKIVPGSFIVTAKDKDGTPVAMVIGPHSTMVFTQPDQEQAETPVERDDKSKWY
jgi:hypothetical protein